MPRRPFGSDLEPLDPLTGEVISEPSGPHPPRRVVSRRRRGLQRLTVGLVMLSLACGVAATYAGTTVSSLRDIERNWRLAMAVDAERQATDKQVLDALREFGDPLDESSRDLLGRIGNEESRHLDRVMRQLGKQVVPDGEIRKLRDDMVAALMDRQLQLQPTRLQIGDSPLQGIDERLEKQLSRWRLGSTNIETPKLPIAEAAVASLKRFADTPTGSTLVVTAGRRLIMIDVDRNSTNEVVLATRPTSLVVMERLGRGLAVAIADGMATAHVVNSPPVSMWARRATSAVLSARNASSLWLVNDGAATLVASDGSTIAGPIQLPPGRELAADSAVGLVLVGDAPNPIEVVGAEPGPIELFDEATGRVTVIAREGRFVAVSDDIISWQQGSSDLFFRTLTGTTSTVIGLPRTDAGRGVYSPNGRVLAFPAGPAAGDRAVIVRYSRTEQVLLGLRGPSTVFNRAPAWSASGNHLFWVTRDQRIAIHDADTDRAALLRMELEGIDLLAVADGTRN